MSQAAQSPMVRRFGVFEAELQTGELRRGGNRVPLQEKPFQLLCALLERPGEVVSRDELAARLWSDVNVDAERGIGEAVFRLRQALGDDAHTPRYIETVPKRGYRFIAAVDAGTRLQAEPEPASPSTAPPGKRWGVYAALALGGALLGVAGISLFDAAETVPKTPLRRWSYAVEKLTVDARTQPVLAISPDGEKLVFGADHALWLQELDELWNPRKLPGTETVGVVEPSWSPDSRKLAFVKGEEIFRLDLSGGAPKRLAKIPTPGFARVLWSLDGKSVLLQCQTKAETSSVDVWETPAAGGDIKPSEMYSGAPPKLSLFKSARGVRALGEGGFVYRTTVVAWNGPGYEPRELTAGRLPQHAASGHVLFQRHDDGVGIWAMPFSADEARPTGEVFVVADGGKSPTVSTDGTLVYAVIPEDYDRLLLLNRNGEPFRHVGERQRYIDSPSFSPDGKRVAVRGFEEATESDWMVDIWIHEVHRPAKARLTVHPRVDLFPQWIDGRRVSFSSDRSRKRGLHARAVDSARPAELLSERDEGWISDWSGDGRRALLWVGGQESDLWVLDVNEEEAKPLLTTPFREQVAEFSPDERYIAFESDRSGSREVWVCPIDNCGGNLRRVSTKGGYQVRWAKEQGVLYYVEDNRRMMQVKITTQPELVIGKPEALFESPYLWLSGSGRPFFYDVTEDGRQFVVIDAARARTTKESPGVIHVWQNWAAAFTEQGK